MVDDLNGGGSTDRYSFPPAGAAAPDSRRESIISTREEMKNIQRDLNVMRAAPNAAELAEQISEKEQEVEQLQRVPALSLPMLQAQDRHTHRAHVPFGAHGGVAWPRRNGMFITVSSTEALA